MSELTQNFGSSLTCSENAGTLNEHLQFCPRGVDSISRLLLLWMEFLLPLVSYLLPHIWTWSLTVGPRTEAS